MSLFFLICLFFISANVYSDVITDDNLSLVKSPTTEVYDIPESLGETRGNNLFHSFTEFDIASGETAEFSGSSNISHIISRISNNNPTVINGTVKSTISGASLWLLSPSGILFGESASIDITGSFYVSTANVLRFSDESNLNTGVFSDTDIFSTSEPQSFNFTSNDPSAIVINGSTLETADDADLNFTAGPINIHSANLNTTNGNLSILSISEAGLIALDGSAIEIGFSDINIQNSLIQTRGSSNESVSIVGGKIVITESKILAEQDATIKISGLDTVISNTTIEAPVQENVDITSDKLVIRDADDASLAQASLTFTQLNLMVDAEVSDNFIGFDSDNGSNILINGELKVQEFQDSIPIGDQNDGLNNINIDNSSASDSNNSSVEGSDFDVSQTMAVKNNVQIEVSKIDANKLTQDSSNCANGGKRSELNTRSILFQPMPNEFNPGRLYSDVDLAQLNTSSSARPTLGIFSHCG